MDTPNLVIENCIQTAIDYLIQVYAENAENPEIILKIFNKLRILHDILKEKALNCYPRSFSPAKLQTTYFVAMQNS
jgi:hypothetical protein